MRHRGSQRPSQEAVAGLALAGLLLAACAGTPPAAPLAPTPTRPPTTGAESLPPLDRTFTSALYGYSVQYPSSFDPRSATERIQGAAMPGLDDEIVDQLTSASSGMVVMASATLPQGVDGLQSWTAATARGFCGTPTSSESITVGGATGTLDTFATCRGYFHQWLTVVRDGLGYHVVWAHERGSEAADRSLFLAMLQTFEFESAPTAPPASAS